MGGGDVGTAFEAALTRTGTSLTSKNLVDMYPLPSSLTEESPIDLKQCKFFDLFDADPAQARVEMDKKRQEAEKLHGTDFMQQVKRSKHHHPLKKRRQFDFRLTSKEKEKLAATGVVASQRMQAESFAEIYYRLYSDDLPVFVTTDSILHAWHRSFDAFLIKLESNYLAPMLEKILKATLSKYQEMYADNSTVKTYVSLQGRTSSVSIAVEDVRNYLTLGLSLLQGELQQQCSKLKDLWVAVAAEQTIDVELFSCRRTVDFSLFKPRGHYNKSEDLKRYFPSSYAEKARWALRVAQVPFVEEKWAPLFAYMSTIPKGGRSVPLLTLPPPNAALTDSEDIMAYCAKTLPELYPNEKAKELEVLFDTKLGPHTRRCAYFTWFQDSHTSKRVMADPVDGLIQRVAVEALYPALRLLLLRSMNINEKSAERSWMRIEGILKEAEKQLGDDPIGSRFLAGDSFSAADIAFCSHIALLILPPEHEFIAPYISMSSIQDPMFRNRFEEIKRSKIGQYVLWCYKYKRPAV
ncbi:Hypothetical protein PHPALM_36866 [Phytophthora palmivora]|uniref:GST N-terminal domain-containing protein n=1 Tax=Phytophthora palmivora TaxID=4796 RepID=A0A2P4WYV4_9STRA|nr:Hypothetical protein PHPALM_36866 [Phytophthora palmivora]